MTRSFSLYLDLLRFGAAMLVLLSHFAYPRFSGGDLLILRELNLGSDAVVLFFVLSGFVIAYCADQKDRNLQEFAFNRATRIFSVALPALILTYICDQIGAWAAPAAYDSWFYNPMSLAEMLVRGLTFSNEWAGFEARLGTNGPYWSMSYEVAYYALFAVAFYTNGLRRIVLLAAGMALFGLNILLLMPAWLAGVWVYHLVTKKTPITGKASSFYINAALMVAIYAVLLAADMPARLMDLSLSVFGGQFDAWTRFSNEVLWNNLIALLIAAHLFSVAQAFKLREVKWPAPRIIRWLAGGSFSVYLVHYPVMQMLDVTLTTELPDFARAALLLGLVIAATLVFAQIFERSLPRQRAALQSLTQPKSPSLTAAK